MEAAGCACGGKYRVRITGVGALASGAKLTFSFSGGSLPAPGGSLPDRATVLGGGASVAVPLATTTINGLQMGNWIDLELDPLETLRISWTETPNNGQVYANYGYRLFFSGCGEYDTGWKNGSGSDTWDSMSKHGQGFLTAYTDKTQLLLRPIVVNEDKVPGDAESGISSRFTDGNSDGNGDGQDPPRLSVLVEAGEPSGGSDDGRIVGSAKLSVDLKAAIASSDPGLYMFQNATLFYDDDPVDYAETSTTKELKSGSTIYLKAEVIGSGSASEFKIHVYDREAGNTTARTHTFKRELNAGVNKISHVDSLTGLSGDKFGCQRDAPAGDHHNDPGWQQ